MLLQSRVGPWGGPWDPCLSTAHGDCLTTSFPHDAHEARAKPPSHPFPPRSSPPSPNSRKPQGHTTERAPSRAKPPPPPRAPRHQVRTPGNPKGTPRSARQAAPSHPLPPTRHQHSASCAQCSRLRGGALDLLGRRCGAGAPAVPWSGASPSPRDAFASQRCLSPRSPGPGLLKLRPQAPSHLRQVRPVV